jgi:hypothetical protein
MAPIILEPDLASCTHQIVETLTVHFLSFVPSARRPLLREIRGCHGENLAISDMLHVYIIKQKHVRRANYS